LTLTSGKAEEAEDTQLRHRKCFELQSSVPKDKQIVIYVDVKFIDGDGKRD
jgi:exosome complex RNA-binding protein Rrp42 (RNase PH superfamily)